MQYFGEPEGRVKIQMMSKKFTAILHTKMSNKRYLKYVRLPFLFSKWNRNDHDLFLFQEFFQKPLKIVRDCKCIKFDIYISSYIPAEGGGTPDLE